MAPRLNLEELPNNIHEIKREEILKESGSDVEISLILPDGHKETRMFKMGTLVSYLKAYIEQKYGYHMAKQELVVKESRMLDPLCLSDIGAIKESETNFIKVRVSQSMYSPVSDS